MSSSATKGATTESEAEDSKSVNEDDITNNYIKDAQYAEDAGSPMNEQTFRKSVQLVRASSAELAPDILNSDGEYSPGIGSIDSQAAKDTPRSNAVIRGGQLSLKINAVAANEVDDDAAEVKKQPSPLRLTVASLSGKESTTSADDVNLVAIPSPRFKGDSLVLQPGMLPQDSLASPKFRESESKAFNDTLHLKRGSSPPSNHNDTPVLKALDSSELILSTETSVIVGRADTSPPIYEAGRTSGSIDDQKETKKKAAAAKSVQFQFDDAAMIEAEKREKMSKPQKSILKKLASPRTKIRVQKKEEDILQTIKVLSGGSVMVKYSTKGVPSKRVFRVSEDGTELLWKKSRGFFTRFELATVKVMIVGPRTQPFAKYEWKTARPWNCFSLIAEHRTVDIECLSKDQFNTWYFGLLNLVPLNYNNMDRAQVLWRVALYKTVQISLQCRMPVNDVWHRLVKEAREDLKKDSNEVNDPAKSSAPEPLTPKSQKFVQALGTTSKAI